MPKLDDSRIAGTNPGRSHAALLLVLALGPVAGAAGGMVSACAESDSAAGLPKTSGDASPDGQPTEMGDATASDAGDCDADLRTDLANCGSCGTACPVGEGCNAGQCQQCTGPELFCADAGCLDLTHDLRNCGACGAVCQAPQGASPLCVNSSCDFTCLDASAESGAPIAKCASSCADLTTSPQNCGSCGASCMCASNVSVGECDYPIEDGGVSNVCVAGACGGYLVSNPASVTFLDACSLPGHVAVLTDVPEWSNGGVVPLPFAFTFFGAVQTQVWLQSQGAIGFGEPSTTNPPDSFPSSAGGATCDQGDPTTSYPAAVAFGDSSLATSGDGVCYAQIGGAEAGEGGAEDAGAPGPVQFVVTWSQAYDTYDPGSLVTFSIVLTQGKNTIDFMYLSALNAEAGAEGGSDPGAQMAQSDAVVGIQSGSSAFTAVSCQGQFIPSTPFDIRFTPVQ